MKETLRREKINPHPLLKAIGLTLVAFFISSQVVMGGDFSNDQIADAIFKAENSKTHPYGILAHYKHTTPRQACINTIIHARKDWNGQGDFIEFLGSRYCPVGAKNDPTGLNKNWIKNVRYFLGRAK